MRPLIRVVLAAVLALVVAVGAVSLYSQAGAAPAAPDVPSAVEVADAATAPEPATVLFHVDWNDAYAICQWFKVYYGAGSSDWLLTHVRNITFFGDAVVTCGILKVRGTAIGAQLCIFYSRTNHNDVNVRPPDPCF